LETKNNPLTDAKKKDLVNQANATQMKLIIEQLNGRRWYPAMDDSNFEHPIKEQLASFFETIDFNIEVFHNLFPLSSLLSIGYIEPHKRDIEKALYLISNNRIDWNEFDLFFMPEFNIDEFKVINVVSICRQPKILISKILLLLSLKLCLLVTNAKLPIC
jgi:hypothetical protein